jgi:sporulation protein YlmC with PRC-barrel domain
MNETEEFTIEAEVLCKDGICGTLKRVVVNPITRTLTHLVVEPTYLRGDRRLVPVGLVDSADRQIRLRCSLSEFGALQEAEETRLLPGAPGEWRYEQDHMLSLPYYPLGSDHALAGSDPEFGGAAVPPTLEGPEYTQVTYLHIPVGEVEIRRGDHVHATDGTIGKVQGLVIDPRDHTVTHVLLEEGHLWGHKEVAIPIAAVIGLDDGVRLSMTKDEVRDLPPVGVDHHVHGSP